MTKIKLKGGPSSGHYSHAGRPGEVGGSKPKGAGPSTDKKKKIEEKPSIYLDSYDEIESTKRGSKGYFITGKDELIDVISDFGGGSNDHVGAFVAMEHPETVGLTKDDAKKFEKLYTEGDVGIMEYWDKIHRSGVIRVREFGKKVYIDTYEMNKSTLRRIQGLMDEGKIRFYPGKQNVWASADNYWDDVRFTYEDIIDADNVDIDNAKLKEETKMTKVKIKLKGGAGSGHHGHAGRPGNIGGSKPKGDKVTGAILSGQLGILLEDSAKHKKYSTEELNAENVAAEQIADKAGAITRREGSYTTLRWHDVPGGWMKHHPKAIHNSKIMISDMLKIGIGDISDKTAAEWIRGLITEDELRGRLG